MLLSKLLEQEKLDSALLYARKGWPIFPVHSPTFDKDHRLMGCSCGKPDCKSVGKHPRISSWQTEATMDEDRIRQWWTEWPDSNIGLPTGEKSGTLVIDQDARHNGDQSLSRLVVEHGTLPATAQARTGNGKHLIFRHPGSQVSNKTALAEGMDVRADGGFIVLAPSTHASGRDYEWDSHPENVYHILEAGFGIADARTRDLDQFFAENPDIADTKLAESSLAPWVTPLADAPGWLLDLIRTRGGSKRALLESGAKIPEGCRDDALISKAGLLRAINSNEEEILNYLRATNKRCEPPLAEADLQRISQSAAKYQTDFDTTDLGNARRLVARHGQDFRFVPKWNKWLVWNGERWVKDEKGTTVELWAKFTVETIIAEAVSAPRDDRRSALHKWYKSSQSQKLIRSMVESARSEPGIVVSPDLLDADPWLLNCKNGTLDLRSGKLNPHDRTDLITKTAPVVYDPNARLDLWDRYLREVTGNSGEMMEFLQRATGYSLTGDTREEKFFLLHGPAAAGKSTFIEAVKAAMGDYAQTSAFETFLTGHRRSGPTNDIAELAGARFVSSVEVDDARQLAEALVQQLTGGDRVSARHMFSENFTFAPQFKIWFAANYAPEVKSYSEATWRRLLLVPFEQVIPEDRRDPHVKETLRNPDAAGPAILAWAVRGCLNWQQGGLGVPPEVRKATAALREEMDLNDPVGAFLADRCDLVMVPDNIDPADLTLENSVTARTLYNTFSTWSALEQSKPITEAAFGRNLRGRGLTKKRTKTVRRWVGLRLRTP
jgi:putative DNA primase/helicase